MQKTKSTKIMRNKPISLRLPWAPSANEIWRNLRSGAVYLSPKYRSFLHAAKFEYMAQGSPKINGTPLLQVVLRLFPPSTHSYDVDNRIKPTLDALTKIGLWKDDRYVRKITVVANEAVKNGAIIVEIDEFSNETERKTHETILSWYGLKPLKSDKSDRREK